MRRTLLTFLVAVVAPVLAHSDAISAPLALSSGNTPITWQGFSIHWAISDTAGIGIRNVSYNGTNYIFRADMPVIRVRYAQDACGPFIDRLTPDDGDIGKINTHVVNGEAQYIRVDYPDSATMRIWIDATVGSYRLQQYWFFHAAGGISARLYSSGLQCQFDHTHHPHWRIDADVSGSTNDQIVERRTDGTVITLSSEGQRLKKNPGVSRWIIRDKSTNKELWISPSSFDGAADTFATWDFAARRYNGLEHVPWAASYVGYDDTPAGGDLVLGSNNAQGIDGEDVLGWYSGHLFHANSLGPTQWVWVGPTMTLN